MNPKQFLLIGGSVLVLVGVLGFIGVIGPTADRSIFGNTWWFDNAENIAHFVLGIAGLASVFILPAMLQKYLVGVLAVVALAVAAYNLMGDNTMVLGANLESPADLLLHLVVGIWAVVSFMGEKKEKPVTVEPAK